MQWFTGTRIGILALAAMFLVFFVIGASMGMFGDGFQPFFGATGVSSSTPTAGRAGTTNTTSATVRPAATATVRR